MTVDFRELFVDRKQDEIVFVEGGEWITIGFRKLLLRLNQAGFIQLLQRFEEISTNDTVWRDARTKAVWVEMQGPGLQMLFTRAQAERFYSLLLNAFTML